MFLTIILFQELANCGPQAISGISGFVIIEWRMFIKFPNCCKKLKKKIFPDEWKLCEIQISESINEVLLEHNCTACSDLDDKTAELNSGYIDPVTWKA